MFKRCDTCNKKTSVLLDCKCNKVFCSKHILPESHKCVELEKFKKDAYILNEKKLLDACKKEKVEWIN